MRTSRLIALLFCIAGAVVLLGNWESAVRRLRGESEAAHTVTIWSNSGSPEHERRVAADFMRKHTDTRIEMHFAQTSSMVDAVFLGFLSGNPPDLVPVSRQDIRDMVAAGMIRPLDDFLAEELKARPDLLKDRFDGEISLLRFYANPNDRFLREAQRYPREAARLLAMHGRMVGFRSLTGFNTLTCNARIFRAVHGMFPEEALVNPDGSINPPRTWSDLVRVSRTIKRWADSEESAARAEGRAFTRPFPLVIQGQSGDDLLRRTIEPLAATAGTRGFDFRGERWIEGHDAPAGRFQYDHPGMLGAFKLLLLLQKEGCILPGTSTRAYEEVRVQVALGRAAMLIDGWHAALIGAERVPWARLDLVSAPIPLADDAAETLLNMKLPRGSNSRTTGGDTVAISALSRSPQAAWKWMVFGDEPEVQRRNAQRGALPGLYSIARHVDDPAWYPFPYQRQAWDVLTRHTAVWPEAPPRSPVRGVSAEQAVHAAFAEQLPDDLDAVVETVRRQLAEYSRLLNEDLSRRVQAGETLPGEWTFANFNAVDPRPSFLQQGAQREALVAGPALEAIRQSIPREYLESPPPFRSAISPWLLLIIPVLLAALLLPPLLRAPRHRRFAYVFVLPAMLMLMAFVVYPSLYQIYLSLHTGTGLGPLRYVGGEHYAAMAGDTAFWRYALPNTAVYMFATTAGQLLLGLLLANLLHTKLPGIGSVRTLFFIPLVTSLAVVSVVFIGLLGGTDSAVNQLAASLGLQDLPWHLGLVDAPGQQVDLLGDPRTDLLMVVLVGIWHGLPYTVILLLAGLQAVDPQLYEAARVDGAGAMGRFRHVTLPEIAPILAVIAFNSLMSAARVFGVVYVLTRGGKNFSSEVVATYIFRWGFTKSPDQQPDIGYASALGTTYALLLAVLVLGNVWIVARTWRRRLARAEGGRR